MHGFWILILSNALVATGLAVLVALIARVWRNPAMLHILWALVLVKLFTPPLVGIPIAGLADRPVVGKAAVALAPPASFEPSDATPPLTAAVERAQPTLSVESSEAVPVARFAGRISWATIVALVWLLGTALGAAIGAWRIVAFARLLRHHATEAPEPVRVAAEKLCGRLALRRCPEILVLRAKIPPIVWLATSRARIILPSGLLDTLGPAAWEAILLHELAHVKRKDGLVRWLEMLSTVCHWAVAAFSDRLAAAAGLGS